MPISSGITSADTLQILPAADAFVSGKFLMREYRPSPEDIFLPEHAGEAVAGICQADGNVRGDAWEFSRLNTGLTALCVILVILYMRKFVTILPYLSGGILRWKKLAELENNMRLGRDRDAVALPASVILCVCASRLELVSPDFIGGFTPGLKTLAVSGIIIAFLLVRLFMSVLVPHRRIGGSTLSAASGIGCDFLIMLSSVLLFLLIPVSVSNACLPFARTLAMVSAAAMWMLFIVRKHQIMLSGCGHLQAFLYLCAVEIIPAAMLVASVTVL